MKFGWGARISTIIKLKLLKLKLGKVILIISRVLAQFE